jgi:hypothetical protein
MLMPGMQEVAYLVAVMLMVVVVYLVVTRLLYLTRLHHHQELRRRHPFSTKVPLPIVKLVEVSLVARQAACSMKVRRPLWPQLAARHCLGETMFLLEVHRFLKEMMLVPRQAAGLCLVATKVRRCSAAKKSWRRCRPYRHPHHQERHPYHQGHQQLPRPLQERALQEKRTRRRKRAGSSRAVRRVATVFR